MKSLVLEFLKGVTKDMLFVTVYIGKTFLLDRVFGFSKAAFLLWMAMIQGGLFGLILIGPLIEWLLGVPPKDIPRYAAAWFLLFAVIFVPFGIFLIREMREHNEERAKKQPRSSYEKSSPWE